MVSPMFVFLILIRKKRLKILLLLVHINISISFLQILYDRRSTHRWIPHIRPSQGRMKNFLYEVSLERRVKKVMDSLHYAPYIVPFLNWCISLVFYTSLRRWILGLLLYCYIHVIIHFNYMRIFLVGTNNNI